MVTFLAHSEHTTNEAKIVLNGEKQMSGRKKALPFHIDLLKMPSYL